jgi:hypothetical protein
MKGCAKCIGATNIGESGESNGHQLIVSRVLPIDLSGMRKENALVGRSEVARSAHGFVVAHVLGGFAEATRKEAATVCMIRTYIFLSRCNVRSFVLVKVKGFSWLGMVFSSVRTKKYLFVLPLHLYSSVRLSYCFTYISLG